LVPADDLCRGHFSRHPGHAQWGRARLEPLTRHRRLAFDLLSIATAMTSSKRLTARLLVSAALLGVVATEARAQDGLRSASLPELTPTSPPPSAPVDIFRVPPDFYRRPQAPVVLPPAPGIGWPTYGGAFPWPSPTTVVIQPRVQAPDHRGRRDRVRTEVIGKANAQREIPDPFQANPAPPPPRAPAPKRTFYIIDGCYAGDSAPDPSRLPAGCSIDRVRTIQR
jgi:hypothetical protein